MIYDTIIIGGGIAGLQASIQLARCLHQVLVIDSGQGRSLIAKNYRNILGYPDGISGHELRSSGAAQARELGVHFVSGEVIALHEDEVFSVTLEGNQQRYQAKTILLATGITDPFPSIPGLSACLGESIFICPDCDGFETINRKTAVIGAGPNAADLAEILLYFTRKLIVINHTGTPIPDEKNKRLASEGIPVITAAVTRIAHEQGQVRDMDLSSGESLTVEKAFLAFPGAKVNSHLLEPFQPIRLGNGHLMVNPRTKETSHRNIWAVGDVIAHSQQVTIAMGDGSQAAIWMHKRLLEMTRQRALVTS